MSEFLGYNPELEEASPDSDQAVAAVESQPPEPQSSESQSPTDQSPELQSPVTLEQVATLVTKNPEIQDFLTQQNLSSEKLTYLYQLLHQVVKNNPNLLTLDLVKKTTTDILASNPPVRKERPFHQRALSLFTAVLLAFLGPAAFKDRSASAAAATKPKAPTTTTAVTPATATAEEIASQISPETAISSEAEVSPEAETIELKTVSEWTFDYETDVHKDAKIWFSREKFEKLVVDMKTASDYDTQIACIKQYLMLTRPTSTGISDGEGWEIAFETLEIERLKDILSASTIIETDSHTIYFAFLSLYKLYRDEVISSWPSVTPVFSVVINDAIYDPWTPYQDDETLEENQATFNLFNKQKFTVDGKEISLKDLNKKIDGLMKQAKKYADKDQKQELFDVCQQMIELSELRRQAYLKLYLELKDYRGKNNTIPAMRLGDYPITDTPDLTENLKIPET